ncbi:MAG: LysR substrate-binding domain-containing protein [Planctomycetaceae bacterium]
MPRPEEPLSIRQLAALVALIDQGSFTRAARHMELSQSTVSGHIADLERRLGVRVVDRDREGAKPTAAGQALLRAARETLRAERSARSVIAELTGLLQGTLVVGASTIPASYLMPQRLARFGRRHPGVALRMVTADSRQILDRLRAGELELGAVGIRPEDATLRDCPLGEDRLVLAVAPGHELAQRKSVPVEELLQHPFVMREEGSGTRAATLAGLSEALGAKSPPKIRTILEVGSAEAIKAAVREGLGAAFVSDLSVRDEVKHGTLTLIKVKGFDVRRRFHLLARDDEALSPAARAFFADSAAAS